MSTTVTRTAGLVAAKPVALRIGTISGPDATDFREELREALASDAHYVVLDETEGARPDAAGRPKEGRPSLTLTGIQSTSSREERSSEGSGDKKKDYITTYSTTQFQYQVSDSRTGEVILEGMASDEDQDKAEDKKSTFLESVAGAVAKGAVDALLRTDANRRAKLIDQLRERLALHQETRDIDLLKDDSMPELEQGIARARSADWPGALEIFQAAVDKYAGNTEVHRAYFDLGVACEYTYQFDRALSALRAAYARVPDLTYDAEIKHCMLFQREDAWQKENLEAAVRGGS